MSITDAITAFSVMVTAFTVIFGVSAWRREFIGKRRIELAENVLALFYEAQDAIREIRNPFGFIGEGATRQHTENETEDEASRLDLANVVFERYQKREKLLAKIRSMKYRFMTTFGSKGGESFDELNRIMNEILSAAHILGTYYWKRHGRVSMSDEEVHQHLMLMNKYEAVIWSSMDDTDDIAQRVDRIVKRIEEIAKKESVIKNSWLNNVWMKNNKS